MFTRLLFLLLYFPRDQSRDVTPRLGEEYDFSFSIVQVHFVICYWISLYFFRLVYSTNMLWLLLYLIRF